MSFKVNDRVKCVCNSSLPGVHPGALGTITARFDEQWQVQWDVGPRANNYDDCDLELFKRCACNRNLPEGHDGPCTGMGRRDWQEQRAAAANGLQQMAQQGNPYARATLALQRQENAQQAAAAQRQYQPSDVSTIAPASQLEAEQWAKAKAKAMREQRSDVSSSVAQAERADNRPRVDAAALAALAEAIGLNEAATDYTARVQQAANMLKLCKRVEEKLHSDLRTSKMHVADLLTERSRFIANALKLSEEIDFLTSELRRHDPRLVEARERNRGKP